MPSNDEITAALRILTIAYDMRTDDDLYIVTRAMLNAAKLIRLAKLERELKGSFNLDFGEEDGSI